MCDICGNSEEKYVIIVEGVEMKVCERCKSLGTMKRSLSPTTIVPKKRDTHRRAIYKKRVVPKEEPEEVAVENFSSIMKQERERRRMTQKEFANLLNIKESFIHNIESARFVPSIPVIKRIEKILHRSLLEKDKKKKVSLSLNSGNAKVNTIGDILKDNL